MFEIFSKKELLSNKIKKCNRITSWKLTQAVQEKQLSVNMNKHYIKVKMQFYIHKIVILIVPGRSKNGIFT